MVKRKSERKREQLERVLKRDNHVCGKHASGCLETINSDPSPDHIIPRSYFNILPHKQARRFNHDWNVQPMHKNCNDMRGGQMLEYPKYHCPCHFVYVDGSGALYALGIRGVTEYMSKWEVQKIQDSVFGESGEIHFVSGQFAKDRYGVSVGIRKKGIGHVLLNIHQAERDAFNFNQALRVGLVSAFASQLRARLGVTDFPVLCPATTLEVRRRVTDELIPPHVLREMSEVPVGNHLLLWIRLHGIRLDGVRTGMDIRLPFDVLDPERRFLLVKYREEGTPLLIKRVAVFNGVIKPGGHTGAKIASIFSRPDVSWGAVQSWPSIEQIQERVKRQRTRFWSCEL